MQVNSDLKHLNQTAPHHAYTSHNSDVQRIGHEKDNHVDVEKSIGALPKRSSIS